MYCKAWRPWPAVRVEPGPCRGKGLAQGRKKKEVRDDPTEMVVGPVLRISRVFSIVCRQTIPPWPCRGKGQCGGSLCRRWDATIACSRKDLRENWSEGCCSCEVRLVFAGASPGRSANCSRDRGNGGNPAQSLALTPPGGRGCPVPATSARAAARTRAGQCPVPGQRWRPGIPRPVGGTRAGKPGRQGTGC